LEITSLLPFEIPSSWSWARFSSIANFSIGKTPERKNPDFWNPSDFHWVSISDLKDKGHIAKTNEFISKKAASVCFSTKPVEAGTLLMSFKLTIGKTSILDIPAYFNEAIVAIKPFLVERSHLDFLFTFIGLLAQLAPKTTAIKGATLNSQKIAEIFLPVPPLAEQARIVARLEELEPLVARYGELEERNRKLDEGIADRLKKSVLKYAMDGKLVAQDPDDEPASELLKRIATEKAALVREGKIKPDKPARGEGEGADKNYYGNLPAGWAKSNVGMVTLFVQRGKSPKYSNQRQYPVLAQKCNQWSGLSLSLCLFEDPNEISKYSWSRVLCPNDIVMNSTGGGTVGRTNLVEPELFAKYSLILPDSHISILRPSALINPAFLFYFLINPVIQNNIESRCDGSTNQMELSPSTIRGFYLPVPPISEQNRIVSKAKAIIQSIDGKLRFDTSLSGRRLSVDLAKHY